MTDFSERVAELSERAARDYERFDPPSDPPDEERAVGYLVDGAGDAVGLYIDARTGELFRFSEAEFESLEGAFNNWLELYAACYGVDIESSFTIRKAAEFVIETHSIRETALLLTGVPDRDRSVQWLDSE